MSLEASTTKVEDGPELAPGRMTKWLDDNYKIEKTRESFVHVLKNWIRFIYGKDSVGNYTGIKHPTIIKRNTEKRINEIEAGIERYFSDLENRDFLKDYKGFIQWMQNEDYANLTIRMRCSKAKIFFKQDPRCKISDDDWKQIKSRLLPKSRRASTQDKILTKPQLKRVLQHSSVHGRALALFLLSTGARIGESCKLKMEDIDLDSDPPQVNIREKYTKSHVGGRVMWFSEEARDAIVEWHKARIGRMKPGAGRGYFIADDKAGLIAGDKAGPEDLVFNYSVDIFQTHWNWCLARADKGEDPPVLAKRDTSTKIRIHIHHVHTLRKFFHTNMKQSGVPPDTVHAWMGHQAYLAAAYDREEQGDLSEIYKEHMDAVTVHEVGLDEKTRAEIKEAIERADKLAKQVTVDGAYIDMVGDQLGAFVGLSENVIEALSGKEKWTLIINKAAQLKADAARSSKEMEKVANQFLIMTNGGD